MRCHEYDLFWIQPPGENLPCTYTPAQKSDLRNTTATRLASGEPSGERATAKMTEMKKKYHVGNESVDFSSCSIGTYSDCASVPRLSMNVYSPDSLFSWMNFLDGFSFWTT